MQVGEQISLFDPDSWSGKMSPEPSVATKERTSEPSSKKRQKSQTKMPLFLDMRESGTSQDGFWVEGGPLLGEYTMHSFGEYPKEERESRLSQILEETPHPKYSLSAKACQGILRRAEKRGKELPSILQKALERQAGLSAFKNAPENQGGGKGILIQNERTGALSTLNNQSVCAEFKGGQSDGGIGYAEEQAPTLSATPSALEPTVCVRFVEAVNQDAKHQQDLIQSDLGIARTIAPGTHASGSHLTKTLVTNIFDARGNGDGVTSPTITGDHENRVTDYTAVCVGNGQTAQTRISDKVGALNCMHDQQAVMQGISGDVAGTLDASYYKGCGERQGVEREVVASSVVRRLTPLECERLQGYPDHWTDIGEWVDSKGKTHKDADSPRYKALGNSIALPFWEWMAKRMVEKLKAEGVEEPTMASLFDGIGGFPLVFSRAGVTPVWASEIEEFPIAVTKRRFPDD